jgi:hypothetical protein
MSVIRPNRTGRAGLLMSVDRGRPEVSAIRSTRRDQPLTDVYLLTDAGFALTKILPDKSDDAFNRVIDSLRASLGEDAIVGYRLTQDRKAFTRV